MCPDTRAMGFGGRNARGFPPNEIIGTAVYRVCVSKGAMHHFMLFIVPGCRLGRFGDRENERKRLPETMCEW